MQDTFYIRFENRFRGSEQHIKKQLQQYTPLLKLLETSQQPKALDLGCGRGEWLNLLTERKWLVQGIDLNEEMVQYCQKRKLKVEERDALSYLKSLDDHSQDLITGFHIAEHVPFEVLLEITQQAYRVLSPEGILLLETPNPENLQVGAHTFYLDPTHRQPLPPQLLQFIAEEAGFLQADIRRLNGATRPENTMAFGDHLQWFFEANPDYALIAQKKRIPVNELNKMGEGSSHYAEFYQIAREYVEETHQRIEQTKQEQAKQQEQTKQKQAKQQEQTKQKQAKQQARIDHLQEKADINEQQVKQLEEMLKIPRLLQTIARYYQTFGLIKTAQHSYDKSLKIIAMKILANPEITRNSLKYLNKTPKLKSYLKQKLTTENQATKDLKPLQKQQAIQSPRAAKILQDIQQKS